MVSDSEHAEALKGLVWMWFLQNAWRGAKLGIGALVILERNQIADWLTRWP